MAERDRNEFPATASIVVACVLIVFSVVGASAAVLRDDLGGAVFASIGFLIGVPYLVVALRARTELHATRADTGSDTGSGTTDGG